jgi:hypothetical protein
MIWIKAGTTNMKKNVNKIDDRFLGLFSFMTDILRATMKITKYIIGK